MESKQKFGILSNWDEVRGFGFIVNRNPDGTRRSWFVHCTRIQRIEDESGIPQVGAHCYFDEEANTRGPLAVNVTIRSLAALKVEKAALEALAGKSSVGGAR
jgi:cold shock CspA family protein